MVWSNSTCWMFRNMFINLVLELLESIGRVRKIAERSAELFKSRVETQTMVHEDDKYGKQ